MTISILDVRNTRMSSDAVLEKAVEDRYLRDFLFPLSLDRYVFVDDFDRALTNPPWTTAAGTGATAAVDPKLRGIVVLSTGATAGTVCAIVGLEQASDQREYWMETYLSVSTSLNIAFEFGLQEAATSEAVQIITDVSVPTVDASVSDLMMFAADTSKASGTAIRAIVKRGDGTPVGVNTGRSIVSGQNMVFGIRVNGKANGFAEFFIDGEKVAVIHSATAMTTGVAVRPVFRVKTNAAAAREMYVDYVQVIVPRS